jgi:tripartite-type tricarboxylate transporter receptor subunit TctC
MRNGGSRHMRVLHSLLLVVAAFVCGQTAPVHAQGGDPTRPIQLVAPAATPQPIVQRLNAELVSILDMPDIRRSFAEQGAEIKDGTAAWFDAFML